MHWDEMHDVTITQTHRAVVDQVTTYELDSEDYVKFLQIDPDDTFAREDFILMHGTFRDEETNIVDLTETTEVVVTDEG